MKKLIIGIAAVLLAMAIGCRIYEVNATAERIPLEIFEQEENVILGKEIFLDETENMEGYSICVLGAKIDTLDEFLEEYQWKDRTNPIFSKTNRSYPENIVVVKIRVKNNNQTEDDSKSIYMLNYTLTDRSLCLKYSSELYEIANADIAGGYANISLSPNSEVELNLPFPFQSTVSDSPIRADTMKKRTLYLTVSLFPVKKCIRVNLEE